LRSGVNSKKREAKFVRRNIIGVFKEEIRLSTTSLMEVLRVDFVFLEARNQIA
jgi:hypothetical protein